MSYTESTFKGDAAYNINCTGDCVAGDEIRFERPTFSGSYRRPTFEGFELVTGKVTKESYGGEKQQHTFTLRLDTGITTRIKGRNLYRNGVWRKPWDDEVAREAARDEKHARGDRARQARDERRMEQEMAW